MWCISCSGLFCLLQQCRLRCAVLIIKCPLCIKHFSYKCFSSFHLYIWGWCKKIYQEFVVQYRKLNAPLLFSILKNKPCIVNFNNTCLKAPCKYHNKIIVNLCSKTVIITKFIISWKKWCFEHRQMRFKVTSC